MDAIVESALGAVTVNGIGEQKGGKMADVFDILSDEERGAYSWALVKKCHGAAGLIRSLCERVQKAESPEIPITVFDEQFTDEERDYLVAKLTGMKLAIAHCDEEFGEDGLCACLRYMGLELLELRRADTPIEVDP